MPPRVLQKGNAVVVQLGALQRPLCAARQRCSERGKCAAVQRQLKRRHHLGQVTHGKGDPAAIHRPQQVAHGRQADVPDAAAWQHFGQGVGKVFQNHDGGRARVLELVLQLARCVERIDIDTGVAGAQHGSHGHGKLWNIGQHDGHACTRLQLQALQPCTQLARALLQLPVAHPHVHADAERLVRIFLHGLFQKVYNGAIDAGVNLMGNTGGIVLEPQMVHISLSCAW